jgi:hypothetical protein
VAGFSGTLAGCRGTLDDKVDHNLDHGGDVVVFTSATPIAVWAALAMDIEDERVMRLAGVLRIGGFEDLPIKTKAPVTRSPAVQVSCNGFRIFG